MPLHFVEGASAFAPEPKKIVRRRGWIGYTITTPNRAFAGIRGGLRFRHGRAVVYEQADLPRVLDLGYSVWPPPVPPQVDPRRRALVPCGYQGGDE